ncbi:MAG TPA: ATP-binding protein [bacterium]|jgi:serine/threonine-protein kinase RsbW
MLRIPSSLEELPHVDAEVERIALEMGFNDDARADLGICVTEAAGNAITHAHHERPDLFVEIRFEQFPDSLRVVVRDHGPGFDVEKVPDPTLPENLMKASGRGLHVIRMLMDGVEVKRLPDGMCIAMTKKLNSKAA